MGNALDTKSDIGAIISDEQLKRTLHYMDIAKKTSSAKVLHGGNQPRGGDYKEGFFYEPTLLSGVPVEGRLYVKKRYLDLLLALFHLKILMKL